MGKKVVKKYKLAISYETNKCQGYDLQHDKYNQHLFLLFSLWILSDSLQPHGPQHARLPLSFTISQNLLKFMSIESVMLPNHCIRCHPLLFKPSVFSSIRVFSNESAHKHFFSGRPILNNSLENFLDMFLLLNRNTSCWNYFTNSMIGRFLCAFSYTFYRTAIFNLIVEKPKFPPFPLCFRISPQIKEANKSYLRIYHVNCHLLN